MKPPRSDKSFIDRLEVHIDTIVNFFISLFETILNISISHHPKKYQLLPPPHEPSQKFLSPDPGKSLHPSTENIATPPPETFQTIEKKSQPLDTNSTTQRKCYPSVEYPPPPKKNNLPTTRKKQI